MNLLHRLAIALASLSIVLFFAGGVARAEPQVDASMFAPTFLAQIPAPTVGGIVRDYRARLGALASVSSLPRDKGAGTYLLTFPKGTVLATIMLESGKIASSLLHDETSVAIRAALVHHFTAPLKADRFSDSFLSVVPIDGVGAIERQLVATAGPFVRLDLRDGAYVAVFTKAEHPCTPHWTTRVASEGSSSAPRSSDE